MTTHSTAHTGAMCNAAKCDANRIVHTRGARVITVASTVGQWGEGGGGQNMAMPAGEEASPRLRMQNMKIPDKTKIN